MSHARLRAALILTAVTYAAILAGCRDRPVREPPPPGFPRLTTQAALAAVDSQKRTGRDPELIATWLALAIQGFAGFGYDTANGDLVIWLKDVRRGAEARAAVAEYLRVNYHGMGGRAGPNPPVRIQPANFDFLELGSIRDRVDAALANEPGLQSLGISVLINRVEVGVDPGAVKRISAVLERAGVPLAAVHVVGMANRLAPLSYPVPSH